MSYLNEEFVIFFRHPLSIEVQKAFYENDYPYLSIFSMSDSFIELTGGKSLHNIPKSL